jgi:hypothetical protein
MIIKQFSLSFRFKFYFLLVVGRDVQRRMMKKLCKLVRPFIAIDRPSNGRYLDW